MAKAIEYDVSLHRLDIAKYFPRLKKKAGSSDTLADFFDYYTSEKHIRESSWRNLNWAWNTHIKPHFGHLKMSAIDKHEILVFRNKLIEAEFSANTVNLIMVQLSGMLLRAHEAGRMDTYPAKGLGRLPINRDKINPFTVEELTHFLHFLEEHKPQYYDMIFIWSMLGFRSGEILALKWDDVDYFNSCVSIKSTLLLTGKEGEPKTPSSRRTIPMRPNTIAAFKRQEKRSRMAGDYVFPNPNTGKRYPTAGGFLRSFKVLLQLAGLKYRSPNQLRHTFATLAIASGENVLWVAEMMGHTDGSMVQKRYSKYRPNLTRKDGDAFESIMEKSAGKKIESGLHLANLKQRNG
jgi:integrase